MKKYLLIIVSLFIIFVTGCSNTKDNIIIYSSMEEIRNQKLKTMLYEKFPDLNINVVYMNTGSNAAKIKSEGTSIEADIILDLETTHMENLKDNFTDLRYYDDSYYVDNINPEHNKYLLMARVEGSIIVNKDYFKKHKLIYPKTYEDLLNKKYKNLIAMPDPKTSGIGYMFYLNVYNELGKKEVIKYFDKLSKNIVQFTSSGSGPMNLLNQDEIAIAMGMTYQGVDANNKGANYKIIELDTKTPYNTTGSAIIKGREEKENVKEVFEYIMTDFNRYDKEHFIPSNILKDEEIKIKNYPSNLEDGNMNNLINVKLKQELLNEWMY